MRRFATALRGKRVLEMGAGCGVLSLALACACDGVASVTATDASSLGFLRRNVDAHRELFVQGAEVKVERLLWRTKEAWQEEVVMGSKRKDGDVEEDEGERQEVEGILVRETDEQDETAGGLPAECAACGDVDIVIGTDLLYHLTAADALFATAKRMLRADGVFVLGGHSRYYGTVQSIRDSARAHGLFVRFVDMRVLRKAEGFEYCAGDFLAVMAERESDIERFASDVNRGVDEEIGEVSTGLDLGEKVSAPAPAAFRFDDSVNDDFEEDEDDDY